MRRIRVGVLRGGPSDEHEISLKTGATMLKHLPEGRYHGIDIFIDRQGVWHIDGTPIRVERVARQVDVVLNGLHGEYGEDGCVQRELEYFSIPYTGSGIFASALSMNKAHAKEQLLEHGIKTPVYTTLKVNENLTTRLYEIFRFVPQPSVVKPLYGGSSLGVSIARDYDGLVRGISLAFERSPHILIEEHIAGREATCAVVEDFRGERYHALMPVEIIPPNESAFFDYSAKYNGKSKEVCPGNFSKEEKDEIQRLAVLVHRTLGLRHYSRADFIVSQRGIYILEVNTLPGLTEASLLPKSLEAGGTSLSDFLEHLIFLVK